MKRMAHSLAIAAIDDRGAAAQALEHLEHELQTKYALRIKHAGWLGRIYWSLRRRWELQDRLERLAPRLPLYFRNPRNPAPFAETLPRKSFGM